MTGFPRGRTALRAGLSLAFVAALAAGALALSSGRAPAPMPARPPAERPELLLITGLPLIFTERFALDGGGSPALAALERRYRVKPIGVAAAAELGEHQLLLMAQPHAQPAEALVELDRWVRQGGRLVLLADPRLAWPSSRPLGDKLRPPPGFADTGLLAHWGLALYAPDGTGPARLRVDGRRVAAVSPGTLESSAKACAVAAKGFVARCRLGSGRATIIADADFLNVQADGDASLDFLLGELARIESQ